MATDKLADFDHVTDYISREAAVAAMTALRQEDIEAFGMVIPECFPSTSAIEALNKIPAADVRPVVRGKWIDIRPINQSTFERIAIKGAYNKCSLCGRLCFFPENFCPRCGAKMENQMPMFKEV